MMDIIRRLLRALGRKVTQLLILGACARFVERATIVLGALLLSEAAHAQILVIAMCVLAISVLHTAVRTRIRWQLYSVALRALTANLLQSSFSWLGRSERDEDRQQLVFDGARDSEQLFATCIPDLLGNSAAALLGTCFLAYELPPELFALSAVLMLGFGTALTQAREIVRAAESGARKAFLHTAERVVAAVHGAQELSVSGMSAEYLSELDRRMLNWRRVAIWSDNLSALISRAPALFFTCVAVVLVLQPDFLASGTQAHRIVIVTSLLPALAGAARAFVESSRTIVHVRRLLSLFDAPRLLRNAQTVITSNPLSPGTGYFSARGQLSVRNVSYWYSAPHQLVLENISFTAEPGEPLAIIGPNASGKSTLIRLLLGVLQPRSGDIRLNGRNLFDLDLERWQRSAVYVPQRPYLPDRWTIRDALEFTGLDFDDAQAQEALERVQLWPTLIHEAATRPLSVELRVLSVGQRQRLVLARALISKAHIWLLDEPDANLDARGCELLAEIIQARSQNRLIVIAAHTQTLIESCSKRVALDVARG